MLQRTITYTDFNGEERTDTLHFNLSKAELLEMELSVNGGFSTILQKIIDEKDNAKVAEYFKEILLKAYGEKSADGKYFTKSKEISEAFSHTGAYDVLYVELATNTEKASEFINGLKPKGL